MEASDQHRDPGSVQDVLGTKDATRRWLWADALQGEQDRLDRSLPTLEERYRKQWDLRVPFLGVQPREGRWSELARLIGTEIWLDDGYRALEWAVAQLRPRPGNNDPTEGYDFGGPGLIFNALQDEPYFGSTAELRWEEIRDFREMESLADLGWSGDLDWLVTQEWELEQRYRRLFEDTSPFALTPMDMAEEEMPTEPRGANLHPASAAVPEHQGEEAVSPSPQLQTALRASTAAEEATILQQQNSIQSKEEAEDAASTVPAEPEAEQSVSVLQTSTEDSKNVTVDGTAVSTNQSLRDSGALQKEESRTTRGETETHPGKLLECPAGGPETQWSVLTQGWMEERETADISWPAEEEAAVLPTEPGRCGAVGPDSTLVSAGAPVLMDYNLCTGERFPNPAEELASRQRAANLSPYLATPEIGEKEESYPLAEEPQELTVIPSFPQRQRAPQGERAGGTSPQLQLIIQGGETAGLTPQQIEPQREGGGAPFFQPRCAADPLPQDVGDTYCGIVVGVGISNCVPPGRWAVGPDPQPLLLEAPVTPYSTQLLTGTPGKGAVGTFSPRLIVAPGEGTGGTSPQQRVIAPGGCAGKAAHQRRAGRPGGGKALNISLGPVVSLAQGTGHRCPFCPPDTGPAQPGSWRSPGASLLPTDYGPKDNLRFAMVELGPAAVEFPLPVPAGETKWKC